MVIALVLALAASPAQAGSSGRWWMDEPIRLVQTNVRETDSTLDARRLIEQVAGFPANTLLFNMGGIVAQYPTRVAFHYPSPHLPPGRDLFGDVLREAHARGLRVIGRFDLSKTQKTVFDAHPEWFFRRASGEPAVYNGLYSACINGGYYREHAHRILAEALERYAVDGLFFNMFGNPSVDYSGRPMGPCHCDACRSRFEAPLRPAASGVGRRPGVPGLPGGFRAGGGGDDRRADPSPAARRGLPHLPGRAHRRDHARVEHVRDPPAARCGPTRPATT